MGAAVRNSSAATVNGSISAAYLKDPASPIWANDATMKQYKAIMAKYAPSANANNGLYFYGFAKAHTFVSGDVQGREEPDAAGPDECPAVAQRDEPVRCSRACG